MNKFTHLVLGDLKLIFRDRMLSLFLFTPFILVIFVRVFVPYITVIYPEIEAYHQYIMMFASLQTAIVFGFITSFMILEEKDEQVIEVIRILPISSSYYVFYRLLFSGLFSALGAYIMLNLGGLAFPGNFNAVLLSLQYGLVAPLITLLVGTFAKNKIEGMAFFKGVNLLLIIPVLSFFLTGAIKYIFAIIPVYWTYLLYKSALTHGNVGLIFIIGTAIYLWVLFILFKQFKKKVFGR